ncbi:MAG: hypothetical protein BroJett024_11820 [Alphaproteobacteria bacterium]|nr:MAG: hypothetical protein BroJett024_11820 [Alphaproteobacteria bacterium]
MLLRRIPEQPMSRLALWSRRVAVFALPVVLLTIVIVRAGFFEIVAALAIFGGALFLAVVAIVLAVGAFVVIWREGYRGTGVALTAVLISLAVLAYPVYLGIKGYRLPPISDITTDPIDPPRFEVIARLRPRDANPIAYAGLHAAELQRAAYPDVDALAVTVSPQQAYEAALAVVTKWKWSIVDARPPQPGRRDGRIEAVARTLIMGFRDDVVVRVRPDDDGARIDVRSASRYGKRGDFGTNASRVAALTKAIDELIAEETEKRATTSKKGKAPAKTDQKSKRR